MIFQGLCVCVGGGGLTAFPNTFEVSKGAKIRNRYKQVAHLTQDTNGKVSFTVRHHKQEPRGQRQCATPTTHAH